MTGKIEHHSRKGAAITLLLLLRCVLQLWYLVGTLLLITTTGLVVYTRTLSNNDYDPKKSDLWNRRRMQSSRNNNNNSNQRIMTEHHQSFDDDHHPSSSSSSTTERILYIVTSIAEYDNGLRSTIVGNDRFTNTLVPVLIESVYSILSVTNNNNSLNHNNNLTLTTFSVDVYLITHYPITKQRYQQLRTQLPNNVGLQLWDNATPYGYMPDTSWTQTTTNTKQPSSQSSSSNSEQQQQQRLQYHTRGLSRQHRYVIKDKIYFYDYFINVEDDMLIKYEHIKHYIQMTNTIYSLRRRQRRQQKHSTTNINPLSTGVKDRLDETRHRRVIDPSQQFYGPMSEHQLGRTIPGFVRVEVVVEDDHHDPEAKDSIVLLQSQQQHPLFNYFQHHPLPRNRKLYHNIPIDYTWDDTTLAPLSTTAQQQQHFDLDATICCHVTNNNTVQQQSSTSLLSSPTAHNLYFWEMNIESLGIRRMPIITSVSHPTTTTTTTNSITNDTKNHILNDLDWVMLLGGSNNELFQKINDPSYIIGDYWSGQYLMDTTVNSSSSLPHHTTIIPTRPDRRNGKYVTNQGGWFGTRRQILEWHTRWCRGSFLPPYDLPTYRLDGLDGRSVEYWSGGLQLVGINGCNLQRIVALRPEYFSKQLLYHTSNNKQRSSTVHYRFSRHSIQEFWGQINTVRKHAERTMNKELGLL